MNKKFIALLSISLMVLPVMALAVALPPEPGAVGGDIKTMVEKVLGKIWLVFAGIAIALFIWAGVMFLTAAGNPEKIAQARQAALWGVVGVVVMIIAFSIFAIAQNLVR